MLSTDLILNPATPIPVGTSLSLTYSLLGGGTPEKTVRSVASSALSYPRELTIGHLKRKLKGFKTIANTSIPAPDVVIDRHYVRADYVINTTGFVYDPEGRLKASVAVTIEIPRTGTSTPTTTQIADNLKLMVSGLCADGNANLERVLNHES